MGIVGKRSASLLGSFLIRPDEWASRLRSRWDVARDEPSAPSLYNPITDYKTALHKWLGVEWPCNEEDRFRRLWMTITRELQQVPTVATRSHDADPALAGSLWCIIRHTHPMRVVETGVARGITSRVILEAMQANDCGHLWSIDLPPLREPWRSQVGAAVPKHLRGRWTYLRGSSRRYLRRVCNEAKSIDVFLHDSLHTRRNMMFEFETAFSSIRGGGILVSDDVDDNEAFARFVEGQEMSESILASAEAKTGLFGLVQRPR